jgi:hypothetical protein
VIVLFGRRCGIELSFNCEVEVESGRGRIYLVFKNDVVVRGQQELSRRLL